MDTPNPILNKQLKDALEHTIELWNTICSIDPSFLHSLDRQETCTNIHDIQNRIYTIAYKNKEFID